MGNLLSVLAWFINKEISNYFFTQSQQRKREIILLPFLLVRLTLHAEHFLLLIQKLIFYNL